LMQRRFRWPSEVIVDENDRRPDLFWSRCGALRAASHCSPNMSTAKHQPSRCDADRHPSVQSRSLQYFDAHRHMAQWQINAHAAIRA
jgi:hypothetical protein